MTGSARDRRDERRRGVRRTLFTGGALALGATVATLAGCGGSAKPSAAELQIQKEATLYQIEQIEKTFHQAATTHDVNLMMTLFAPGAVFNLGTETYTGLGQIRNFWATQNKAFFPQNHWQADTPSFRIKATVNGDKGTLYFECDFIDIKTGKLMAAIGVDHQVQEINGRWLIVDSSAAPTSLTVKG
jgi:SnoaL-like domain